MTEPRSKYGNKRAEADGYTFHSKAEAARYRDLALLLAAGAIGDLRLQPRFVLKVNGERICEYRGDFAYLENGHEVIEDVKGHRTRDYVLKRKLMHACLGIDVREVQA